jgi:hypothetical protein
MQKAATLALFICGLSQVTEAYKVRRWSDMFRKKPMSEQGMKDLQRKYDVIYTLGYNALVDADNSDSFGVQDKFGINLTDKNAEGSGLNKLAAMRSYVEAKAWDVDRPAVPQDWLTLLRDTFDTLEQEMLKMNAALAYAAGHQDLVDSGSASKLRAARDDFLYHGKSFESEEMWSIRSWYWVWKMQGFPENGYQILKQKMTANLNTFDDIQKAMFNAYGDPSYEFSQSQRGPAHLRISNMRQALNDMFADGASNETISNAFEVVSANWRDFSLEFVSVNSAPTSDSKGADYDFHSNYNEARKALFSYGEDDSIRGLITFAMNRVSWAGMAAEKVNERHLLKYGNWSCRYFYDEFQRRAVSMGAAKRGYLSDDVDDDFYVLAQKYKEARDGVLLYGVDHSEGDSMKLAKIVWRSARDQFKYMLAMNDIMVKAEKQMARDENDILALNSMSSEIIEYKYANAQFPLSAQQFWELFTGPSLQVMLHYSVNSYTDDAVEIKSPLAVAAIAYD